MAATKGHGNPNWTRDETILALALYLRCGDSIPGGRDPRVIALSEQLRSLAIHPREHRVASFRNPDGVSFKLQNLRQVASGKGLSNVSRIDREVWADFANKPEEVARLAALISDIGSSSEATSLAAMESGEEFIEGRLVTAIHHRRERSPKLRAKLLTDRSKAGTLHCDGCGWSSGINDTRIADAAFEAHHLVPLSEGGPRSNSIADLALLCANCHRIVHRWIALKREWMNAKSIRELLGGERASGPPPIEGQEN